MIIDVQQVTNTCQFPNTFLGNVAFLLIYTQNKKMKRMYGSLIKYIKFACTCSSSGFKEGGGTTQERPW